MSIKMTTLNEIFAFVSFYLNDLYEVINDKKQFKNDLTFYLKDTLNSKTLKRVLPLIKETKHINVAFKRFYNNWYSFQLLCFYEDNPTDNREALDNFVFFYNRGDFGSRSYISEKMFQTSNGRLIEFISLMEELRY